MSLYSVKVSLKLRAGVAQRPIFAYNLVQDFVRTPNGFFS